VLAVSVSPGRKPKPGSDYLVEVSIRENALPGPFGALLRITTDSLDQPVVEVPVFGIVAPRIEIEPTTVLLRKDGTQAGSHRRLRLRTADASPLHIQSVECDLPEVIVGVDAESSARYSHLAYIDVQLTGALPKGTHPSIIRVATDVVGAENVEVPLRVEIP